jgi:hypothetical protein
VHCQCLILAAVLSDHPTAVVVGTVVGIAVAVLQRISRRVRRLVVGVAVLALTGGAGAGGVTAVLHAVVTWR